MRAKARNWARFSAEAAEERGGEGFVGLVDGAAEDEDGADAADVEQRGQREEQRGEHARAEACEDGVRVEVELRA